MAILLAVACDQSRQSHILPKFKLPVQNITIGLAAAMIVFVSGYWGMHIMAYGPNGFVGPISAEKATHSHNPENPHGPEAEGGIGAPPTRKY